MKNACTIPLIEYFKTRYGKANVICFISTFLADLIIFGTFAGIAGGGVPLFTAGFLRSCWISNLVGIIFYGYQVEKANLLKRVSWKKVEFYSAVIVTIIL